MCFLEPDKILFLMGRAEAQFHSAVAPTCAHPASSKSEILPLPLTLPPLPHEPLPKKVGLPPPLPVPLGMCLPPPLLVHTSAPWPLPLQLPQAGPWPAFPAPWPERSTRTGDAHRPSNCSTAAGRAARPCPCLCQKHQGPTRQTVAGPLSGAGGVALLLPRGLRRTAGPRVLWRNLWGRGWWS